MSLSNKLSITDVDLKGKRVLIRVSEKSHLLSFPFASNIVLFIIFLMPHFDTNMDFSERSTSMFPSTLTRRSQTINVSLVPSPLSSMPSTTARRLSY